MEGVQSSRLDETFGGRVEHTGLIFKTVPQEQVQDIINKLDGKTASQMAKNSHLVSIISGHNIRNAIDKLFTDLRYPSIALR
ncbi:MAG: hypothetical protein ACPL0A_01365, partial [Candidatus Micrarchaeia archaeon]